MSCIIIIVFKPIQQPIQQPPTSDKPFTRVNDGFRYGYEPSLCPRVRHLSFTSTNLAIRVISLSLWHNNFLQKICNTQEKNLPVALLLKVCAPDRRGVPCHFGSWGREEGRSEGAAALTFHDDLLIIGGVGLSPYVILEQVWRWSPRPFS